MLKKVSAERIQVELVKLLTSVHPEEMRTVYATGIADVVLPEFSVMMRTPQNNPHHCYTVGEHTIEVLKVWKQTRCYGLQHYFMMWQSPTAAVQMKMELTISTGIRRWEQRRRRQFYAD